MPILFKDQRNDEVLLLKAAKDKFFLIRLLAVAKLNEYETKESLIEVFLRDKSSAVRALALTNIQIVESPQLQSIILNLTSDVSSSVRAEARRIITLKKNLNFASHYRDLLKDQQPKPGAILGLSEVGNKDDIELLSSFIKTPDNRLRKASLLAINNISRETARPFAITLLEDNFNSVRNVAIHVLNQNILESDLSALREIYIRSNSDIKISVLKVLYEFSGWAIITDIIRATMDPDQRVSEIAWNYLFGWYKYIQHVFTKPDPKDLSIALDLYNKAKSENIIVPLAVKSAWDDLPYYLSTRFS